MKLYFSLLPILFVCSNGFWDVKNNFEESENVSIQAGQTIHPHMSRQNSFGMF